MKTNSKKFSIKDWFEKNSYIYLLLYLPFYYINSLLLRIFSFGDQMYLRSNCIISKNLI